MINKAIPYLNTQIKTLGLFTMVHELATIETRKNGESEVSFPATYCGGGEPKAIDFDYTKATIYHRLTGAVNVDSTPSIIDPENVSIVETFPLRIVALFPLNILSSDDSYISWKVSNNIASVITIDDTPDFRAELDVAAATVNITSVETDNNAVWEDEASGSKKGGKWSQMAMIAVDYDLIVRQDKRCLEVYTCGE